jgi:hypothetical protein
MILTSLCLRNCNVKTLTLYLPGAMTGGRQSHILRLFFFFNLSHNNSFEEYFPRHHHGYDAHPRRPPPGSWRNRRIASPFLDFFCVCFDFVCVCVGNNICELSVYC